MLVSQGELSSSPEPSETPSSVEGPFARGVELLTFQPQVKFQLDRDQFCRNLQR